MQCEETKKQITRQIQRLMEDRLKSNYQPTGAPENTEDGQVGGDDGNI